MGLEGDIYIVRRTTWDKHRTCKKYDKDETMWYSSNESWKRVNHKGNRWRIFKRLVGCSLMVEEMRVWWVKIEILNNTPKKRNNRSLKFKNTIKLIKRGNKNYSSFKSPQTFRCEKKNIWVVYNRLQIILTHLTTLINQTHNHWFRPLNQYSTPPHNPFHYKSILPINPKQMML